MRKRRWPFYDFGMLIMMPRFVNPPVKLSKVPRKVPCGRFGAYFLTYSEDSPQ